MEIYYYYYYIIIIYIFCAYIYELDFEQMLGMPTQMYCEELVVQHIYSTGWGGESWTTFCGPAAVAIGRCERKD